MKKDKEKKLSSADIELDKGEENTQDKKIQCPQTSGDKKFDEAIDVLLGVKNPRVKDN